MVLRDKKVNKDSSKRLSFGSKFYGLVKSNNKEGNDNSQINNESTIISKDRRISFVEDNQKKSNLIDLSVINTSKINSIEDEPKINEYIKLITTNRKNNYYSDISKYNTLKRRTSFNFVPENSGYELKEPANRTGYSYSISNSSPTIVNNLTENKNLLKATLNDHEFNNLFILFLKKEHSEENYEFYVDLQIFKSLKTEKERADKACEIREKYFNHNSPKNINVDSIAFKEALNLEKEVSIETFNLAENQVTNLITTDIIPRFLNSKEYNEFLKKKSFQHGTVIVINNNNNIHKHFVQQYSHIWTNKKNIFSQFKKQKSPNLEKNPCDVKESINILTFKDLKLHFYLVLPYFNTNEVSVTNLNATKFVIIEKNQSTYYPIKVKKTIKQTVSSQFPKNFPYEKYHLFCLPKFELYSFDDNSVDLGGKVLILKPYSIIKLIFEDTNKKLLILGYDEDIIGDIIHTVGKKANYNINDYNFESNTRINFASKMKLYDNVNIHAKVKYWNF